MAGNGSGGIVIAAGVLVVAGIFGVLAVNYLHRPLPLPKPRSVTTSTASDEVDIDVYLDGSKSMRQFLKGETPGQMNYLRSMLLDLGTRMNSAHGNHSSPGVEWSNATVNYWNFGAFRRSEVDPSSQHPFAKPLAEADLRELAENPDSGFNATRTPIEKPIIETQGGTFDSKLKVIITDLYQSGANTATYANPLANQYLDSATKAVEVIAVRNPFAGMVDDLPGCGTLSKAADTMPFYVIVAGSVGDVRRAVEVLKGTTGLSAALEKKRTQEWFFSKAPMVLTAKEQQPQVRIQNTRLKNHPWENLQDFSKNDYPRVEGSEEAGLTELLMRKGAKAEVSWPTPANVDGKPVDKTELSPEVTVSRSKDKTGSAVEDLRAKEAVEMSCRSGDADGLCVTIDEGRLNAPSNYLVEIDLMARPALGSNLPGPLKPGSELMGKWNIEVSDAQSLCRAHGSFPYRAGVPGEHAGMTPQLSQFLVALDDKKLNTPVRIATYSLYVKAR